MAGLTNSRNTPEWPGMSNRFHWGLLPVEASTNIYVGGMVALNANGNAVPAQARGSSPLDILRVMGICEYVYAGGIMPPGVNALNQTGNGTLYPSASGTLGAAGAISVGVLCGCFGMDVDNTIAQANVGELVFASDDHTVSLGTAVPNTTTFTTPASGLQVMTLHPDIVPGTFAAYSATGGGGTHFKEGVDFAVDYQAGLFVIPASGSNISTSTPVYVTYYYAATRVVAGRLIAMDAGLAYVNFYERSAAL